MSSVLSDDMRADIAKTVERLERIAETAPPVQFKDALGPIIEQLCERLVARAQIASEKPPLPPMPERRKSNK